MKAVFSKRLAISLILAIAVGFIGVGVRTMASPALRPTTLVIQPKAKVHTETPPVKSSSETPKKVNASPQVTPQTTPAATQPTPPTPEQNKARVMKLITDYAASVGMNDNETFAQTLCFDRAISTSVGYNSYDDILNADKFPILSKYLAGTFYFDGATCRAVFKTAQ